MPFFRRSRDDRPVPAWARPLAPAAYERFVDAVRTDLERRGLSGAVDEARGAIEHDGTKYGLANLAQTYAQASRRDRSDAIRRHFDAILSARREREQASCGWESARRLLKVRLYPDDIGGRLVRRDVAEGLIEALALDLPSSVASVREDEAASWEQQLSELFRVGYENVEDEPPPRIEQLHLGRPGPLLACSGESFFTTTHLLWIERLVDSVGDAGLIVAVPHRHSLLAYPIEDLRVVDAIGPMIALTERLHANGPGSLSEHLYWWQAGRLTLLPHHLEGDALQFVPPESFVELLNGLAPAPKR